MQELYRMIPKVDAFLKNESARLLIERYGRPAVTKAAREEIQKLKTQAGDLALRLKEKTGDRTEEQSKGNSQDQDILLFQRDIQRLQELVEENLKHQRALQFHHVINATGIVLDDRLGRAPLSHELAAELGERITGYSNLEYDLETGSFGERSRHLEEELLHLTHAEAAVAVHNHAAAVLLALIVLTEGREVLVAQRELFAEREVVAAGRDLGMTGGTDGLLKVIAQNGITLKRVGTASELKLEDYKKAIGKETGAILQIHTNGGADSGIGSNADGWRKDNAESGTESNAEGWNKDNLKVGDENKTKDRYCGNISIKQLSSLGLPVIEDLDSGVLVNLEDYGMQHEFTVQEALEEGAQLVCFSGDKLLGGPEAGIIVGKKVWIDQIKAHPLMGLVRIDKYTAAALELVLQQYLKSPEEMVKQVPVLQMLSATPEQLVKKAESFQKLLLEQLGRHTPYWKIEVETCVSEAGGDLMPGVLLEGTAVTIRMRGQKEETGTAYEVSDQMNRQIIEWLQTRLRLQKMPMIGQIRGDRLWLDLRTVFDEELPMMAGSLAQVMKRTE